MQAAAGRQAAHHRIPVEGVVAGVDDQVVGPPLLVQLPEQLNVMGAEIEDFLLTANITKNEPLGEGITRPRRLTLEQAMAWIEDDELVEVTPQSIRLRKKLLQEHERRRADRG